jgi:hypothetical protein
MNRRSFLSRCLQGAALGLAARVAPGALEVPKVVEPEVLTDEAVYYVRYVGTSSFRIVAEPGGREVKIVSTE